ncbi:MAG TPA: hypothetical protein VFI31_30195 [Pirellulales bacterium]|nr:hypothetical protein [Pirellulales bacterium]
MLIQLTEEQGAGLQNGIEMPPRVSGPDGRPVLVLLKAESYERFKALFEEVPISNEERRFQLEQFGKRAGWDDPAMDIYDDLDPRRRT